MYSLSVQCEQKFQSASFAVAYGYVAVVKQYRIAYNRQAEARAAIVACAAFGHAVKTFKQARQMLFGHPLSRVAHREVGKLCRQIVA